MTQLQLITSVVNKNIYSAHKISLTCSFQTTFTLSKSSTTLYRAGFKVLQSAENKYFQTSWQFFCQQQTSADFWNHMNDFRHPNVSDKEKSSCLHKARVLKCEFSANSALAIEATETLMTTTAIPSLPLHNSFTSQGIRTEISKKMVRNWLVT